jgi:hypothetical protein
MEIKIKNPDMQMASILATSCGLDAYLLTLAGLHEGDITGVDGESYRKNFISYYRLRRDENWLGQYFAYLEKHKNDRTITFREILTYLSGLKHHSFWGESNAIEASFASKLLHTINPNHPIWDHQVLQAVKITLHPWKEGKDRFEECVRDYEELSHLIERYLLTPEGKECLRVFDVTFPDYQFFSPYKKIDFYLWKMER